MTEVQLRRDGYVTATEAVTASDKSVASIYRWTKKEKIKGINVAGQWWIHLKSLQDYLAPKSPGEYTATAAPRRKRGAAKRAKRTAA